MTLILSGTDGLSDIDGSASTPAIRGTDANTGIFFPAADTIAFSEGGAEVARFNADAQFVSRAGTVSLPVLTTTGDLNTGIFFPAADTIALSAGGAQQMSVAGSSVFIGSDTLINLFDLRSQSLGSSGYKRLTGGLILQWGSVVVTTNVNISVSFPIAFPSSCYCVVQAGSGLTQAPNGGRQDFASTTFSWATTGFTVRQYNALTATAYQAWFAIGI
jgi:hypothetical protein